MEDTKVDVKDEAVEGWLKAEDAKSPIDTTKEKAIRDANIPAGVGMRFHSLEEAGWVHVYDQKTGDRSTINRNWLQMQLGKTHPDGSRAFGLHPPKDKDGKIIVPFKGEYKCLLHKDDPDRAFYDGLGFDFCLREGMPSLHAQRLHMQKKHKAEWATIEEGRKTIEKKEERDFQRALYTRLAAEKPAEEKAPLYVSDKDKENK